MRKLALALAALAAISVAMPYAALADTVIVHKHRNHMYNYVPPAHHDKTVIIKHHNDY